MTLLILPLVDAVSELDVENLATLWMQDSELLTSFVISFVVIYAFWTSAVAAHPQLRCRFALDSGSWLNLIQDWIQMMIRDGVASALDVSRHADALLAGRDVTWIGSRAQDHRLAGAGAGAGTSSAQPSRIS